MKTKGTKSVRQADVSASSKSVPLTSTAHIFPSLIGNRAMGQLLAGSKALPAAINPISGADGTIESASNSGAMITLSGRGMRHPVAESMRRPGTRFRLPKFAEVKSAYEDKDLKIPEAVIKSRVTQLLMRMEKEGRLKSKDPVLTIVNKIFPAPGKIDEAEFNNAINVKDRSSIYESLAEADTKVKAADKTDLQKAMVEAADLAKKVQGDAAGLTAVFGKKDAVAKKNYGNAEKALRDLPAKMDAQVTTDYNLDDKEVGLGGWASHEDMKMHLLLDVAQVKDIKRTKATLIHEASHFGNASVDDHVYYGKDGFFELSERKKVNNAAHYEELPRRDMGISQFDKKTFVPGAKPGGGAVTREDKIKAAANLYMRKAWDCGVDAHIFIRSLRREELAGNKKPFKRHKALVFKISKLMDLTIHEQAAGKETVTTLDVTLSESISRGVNLIFKETESVPFPAPGKLKDKELRDQIIAEAVKKYGNLLKDPARDKKLLDWLEAHYRSLPEIKS